MMEDLFIVGVAMGDTYRIGSRRGESKAKIAE